jgi:membrane-bound lytic murein transglycosylase MltF
MDRPAARMLGLTLAVLLCACGGDEDQAKSAPAKAPTAESSAATDSSSPDAQSHAPTLEPATPAAQAPAPLQLPDDYQALLTPRFDDLDGIAKSRAVRVLVVHSKLFYFLDEGQQRGVTYEALQAFEQHLNRKLKTKTLKINVIPIPVARDQLLPALVSGRGDIAAAGLTITEARRASVDFSAPFAEEVEEIVITGPNAPALATLHDLAGKTVWVRRSSSYHEHLTALNKTLKSAGRPPIEIRAADENLEDEDLIEMVAAGVLPMTVADSYLAEFWSQVFESAKPRPDLAVHSGNQIAWALRKNTPQLAAVVNEFVRTHRSGTRSGNIVLFKYLKSTKWVRNALADEEVSKLRPMAELFQTYSDRFDFDWLMVAAQAYQESGLDQKRKSHVGAVGVMQVMPTTAADRRVNVKRIEQLEPNIHAGTKYLRLLADEYFADPAIDERNRMLFCFAAYNAGPNRVQSLRREAAKQGLDPNKWFQNVEIVAARRVGRETVQYVSNIYKYYLAYQLMQERDELRRKAVEDVKT